MNFLIKKQFFFIFFSIFSLYVSAEDIELFPPSAFSKSHSFSYKQTITSESGGNFDLDSNPILISSKNLSSTEWKYGEAFSGCLFMNAKDHSELDVSVTKTEDVYLQKSQITLYVYVVNSNESLPLSGVCRAVLGFKIDKLPYQNLKKVRFSTSNAFSLYSLRMVVRSANTHNYYLSQDKLTQSWEFMNFPSILWNEITPNISRVSDPSINLKEDIDYIGICFEINFQGKTNLGEKKFVFYANLADLKYTKD